MVDLREREALSPAAPHRRSRAPRGPVAAILVCLLLAIASAFALPSTPSYDPWGWIVWGRELAFSSSAFATTGGPSWKPLPVMFTTLFALFGGAAPKLWLIAARAGGLLALVSAYRLAARLVCPVVRGDAREAWLTSAAAGALAAIALALTEETTGSITQGWVHYLFRGASEPMLVACVLWAIDRHLDGRRGTAFVLGLAASLIRPEAWPFLALYAVWLWRNEPRLRVLLVGGLAAVPLLWLGPSWLSVGDPLSASRQAQHYSGHLGRHPLLETVRRGGDLTIVPVLCFALAGTVLAWRADDRLTLRLAAGALAWVALVALMAVGGYPGLGRFMYPAAAVACVLGGAGALRLARLGGGGRPAVALGALLLVITAPFAYGRASRAVGEKSQADLAVRIDSQLQAAVHAAGGRRRVLPCRTSVAAVNHTMQTSLAWTLHAPLAAVRTTLRRPGVNFVAPHLPTIDGAPAPVRIAGGWWEAEVARAGVWRVLRVMPARGGAEACIGF